MTDRYIKQAIPVTPHVKGDTVAELLDLLVAVAVARMEIEALKETTPHTGEDKK